VIHNGEDAPDGVSDPRPAGLQIPPAPIDPNPISGEHRWRDCQAVEKRLERRCEPCPGEAGAGAAIFWLPWAKGDCPGRSPGKLAMLPG